MSAGDLVWVELDAGAPGHNLGELRRAAGGSPLVCAVVKSNAYGHGLAGMVGLIPGADWLGVNSIDEGIALRRLGEDRPVLVLGHVPLGRLHEALAEDLRLTVYNFETLDALRACASPGTPARLHLKVETGTGRQGIHPGRAAEFAASARSIPGVELEGLSTHFANIEDTLNHSYAESQLDVFGRVLESFGPDRPRVVHTACTAAAILFPETSFDMIRAGIGLYGLWPSRETFLSAGLSGRPVPDLRPVLAWKTRIVQLKEMPSGSFIGYGCSYRTTRTSRIAVLPVGYYDGYDRALGNAAHVLVRGMRAPVVGRICMNLCMADVTDVPGAALEDEVVLLGRDGDECVPAEMLASWAGTINYEVVARINPLLPRRIVSAGSGPESARGEVS